nr:MAG TPA: hypothetical protein [Caudoviricetes sp.]
MKSAYNEGARKCLANDTVIERDRCGKNKAQLMICS